MSAAEEALWTRLRVASFGKTFRCQMPVGRLTADFGSYEAKLVIEIDGGVHDAARGSEHARSAAFESAGYLVLRFGEDEVLGDADAVTDEIAQAMKVWSG
jgi:very-short-patch-repair endonuclease